VQPIFTQSLSYNTYVYTVTHCLLSRLK